MTKSEVVDTMKAPGGDRLPGASRTRSNRQRRRDKARARLLRTGCGRGGLGGSVPKGPLSTAWDEQLSRSDLAALRTAVRRDWSITPAKRAAFVDRIVNTLRRSGGDTRLAIAVGETMLAMDAANLRGRAEGGAP